MNRYRNHPEYAAGFDDGWRGDDPRSSGAAYMAGHASANSTKTLLTGAGFAETAVPDISFHVRLPSLAAA